MGNNNIWIKSPEKLLGWHGLIGGIKSAGC